MEWILTNYPTVIALIIAPVITWFFVKRHFQERELKLKDTLIDSSQSDVVSKNLEIYQRMLDDVENRYQVRIEGLDEIIEKQRSEIEKMESEILDLKDRIRHLESLIETK